MMPIPSHYPLTLHLCLCHVCVVTITKVGEDMGFKSISEKLNPRRFPGMSGKMAGILGQMLGQNWTDPALVELCITSDGFLLGMQMGDVGFNELLGTETELEKNLARLMELPEVGLTAKEKALIWQIFQNIKRW